jgi:hypothetical protein
MLPQPASIYINWAAYDELSDTVELTEKLALRQFDEMLRLRDLGVRFDGYVMDCFWFSVDGGFRAWRKPHWPDGPDRWLNLCLEHAILPGLWLPTNSTYHPLPEKRLRAVPEWSDSLDGTPEEFTSMCLFYGGYLPHLIASMHLWYERGVRIFKFDFADFKSAPRHLKEVMLPSEIRTANVTAFQGALRSFRKSHPEALLLAYNGFEEGDIISNTVTPLRKAIDSRWLESFDGLYCGDPRPADVPAMNFWRSKDVYSDHMTRYYEFNNIPLKNIDNTAFMIGLTGTCYYRGTAAWKGMLLLSLARGGWANTYYGNLELLGSADAAWFAKAQSIFYPLQAKAPFSTFGEMPGSGRPYGYLASGEDGALATVGNPSQEILTVGIPLQGESRLLFRDAGFQPILKNGAITLGPEQMALVGSGNYATAEFDLGIQEDVLIPDSIRKIDATFSPDGEKAITTTLAAPGQKTIRVILRQTDSAGLAKRTSGGAAPDGTKMASILTIAASQDGKKIAVIVNYDKAVWSGLSWAVAEIPVTSFDPSRPLTIRCSSQEPSPIRLTCDLHLVTFGVE